jgi:hypothetical protein
MSFPLHDTLPHDSTVLCGPSTCASRACPGSILRSGGLPLSYGRNPSAPWLSLGAPLSTGAEPRRASVGRGGATVGRAGAWLPLMLPHTTTVHSHSRLAPVKYFANDRLALPLKQDSYLMHDFTSIPYVSRRHHAPAPMNVRQIANEANQST